MGGTDRRDVLAGRVQRRGRAVGLDQPFLHHLLGVLFGLGLGQLAEAVGRHGGDDREDAPGQIGAAGRLVVVGGVV